VASGLESPHERGPFTEQATRVVSVRPRETTRRQTV
jgi:hypothetical protein